MLLTQFEIVLVICSAVALLYGIAQFMWFITTRATK